MSDAKVTQALQVHAQGLARALEQVPPPLLQQLIRHAQGLIETAKKLQTR